MEQQVFNPYLPSYEYVPDGEPHVFGQRVYIYGSHDQFDGNAFCMKDYVCWSAPVDNLTEWKCEGVIYRKEQDRYIPDAANRRMFAPDVQKGPDGRFYLYYAFDFSGVIGVAVCDSPAGAYEYYGHVHYADGTLLGQAENDYFHYDPAVLAEPDGGVYLYTGFRPEGEMSSRFSFEKPTAPGAMVTQLEKDMITVKKAAKIFIPSSSKAGGTEFEGHAFFEASSIRKVRDTYYFIYSSENFHELCYAVSKEPDQGYRYGGTIVSNGDLGYLGRKKPLNYTGTNHGSIEKIDGKWYVFYHRQTNGNPYSRQGCAEKIQILEDGSIPQVEITSCGLNKGPLRGRGFYSAGIACCLMGPGGAAPYIANTQISEEHPYITQDGELGDEQYIVNMRSGAMAGYRYFAFKNPKKIAVKVRGNGTGRLKIRTEAEGKIVSEIPVNPSDRWTEITADISAEDGERALWFAYEGAGSMDFLSFMLI